MNKKLPVGVQSFGKMIRQGYIYVDKTQYIYNMLSSGSQYYFLSRPRRFGKSLLISTLKELFNGNRELFEGLWIHDKVEWTTYPVIHIDFSNLNYETPDQLKNSLSRMLDRCAEEYKVSIDRDSDYKLKFAELIRNLSAINPVVILVDEYDKPIIDMVDRRDVALMNRDILRNFYSTIKGSDEYLRFAFLTGVSKFSRVSVFSGLNNLRDITLSKEFSTLLGYSEEEIHHYFQDRIEVASEHLNAEPEALMKTIAGWYDGYSWDGDRFVYNPFSMLNFFQEFRFDNYWFSSGTPSMLVKLIADNNIPIPTLEDMVANSTVLDSFDIENMEVASLLFQTGYLTIKKTSGPPDNRIFHLSFPNREVKESFHQHLLKDFTHQQLSQSLRILTQLKRTLNEDNLEEFFGTITSLFSSIPYNIFIARKEAYYHTVIYLALTLLEAEIHAEVQTNNGRLDAVIHTDTSIYIMEFKIDSPTQALSQIKEKQYHQKYLPTSKEIKLVGVGFNPNTRNISGYETETILPK